MCNDYVNFYICICKFGYSGINCYVNDNDCIERWVWLKGGNLEEF